MAARFDPTDPRCLTPTQRLEQLTALFAAGARRWLPRRAKMAALPAPPSPVESAQNPLDMSPRKSVHVPVRLTEVQPGEGVEA
jgi:hypothetical protein